MLYEVITNKKLKINSLIKSIQTKDKKIYHFSKYISPDLSAKIAAKQKTLLKYIMAVYEVQVKDLSDIQKEILSVLAVLPQLNITFSELTEFLEISDKETDNFINELLKLHQLGRNNFV